MRRRYSFLCKHSSQFEELVYIRNQIHLLARLQYDCDQLSTVSFLRVPYVQFDKSLIFSMLHLEFLSISFHIICQFFSESFANHRV